MKELLGNSQAPSPGPWEDERLSSSSLSQARPRQPGAGRGAQLRATPLASLGPAQPPAALSSPLLHLGLDSAMGTRSGRKSQLLLLLLALALVASPGKRAVWSLQPSGVVLGLCHCYYWSDDDRSHWLCGTVALNVSEAFPG